jgi:hypothetical protein
MTVERKRCSVEAAVAVTAVLAIDLPAGATDADARREVYASAAAEEWSLAVDAFARLLFERLGAEQLQVVAQIGDQQPVLLIDTARDARG